MTAVKNNSNNNSNSNNINKHFNRLFFEFIHQYFKPSRGIILNFIAENFQYSVPNSPKKKERLYKNFWSPILSLFLYKYRVKCLSSKSFTKCSYRFHFTKRGHIPAQNVLESKLFRLADFCLFIIYILYIAVCTNFEPLIYQYINISSAFGKGSTMKFASSQSNVDKLVISSIY